MNPFDWQGPDFLAFYSCFAALVIVAQWQIGVMLERSTRPQHLPLADPYQIAVLSGGDKAAVAVAVLSLLDRNVLALEGKRLIRARDVVSTEPSQPLERAIYQRATELIGSHATQVRRDDRVRAELKTYRRRLSERKLLPDRQMWESRALLFLVAAFLLVACAATKIELALERGRPNVGFLILLACASVFLLVLVTLRRRSGRGDAALADIRRLCGGLRARAASIRPRAMTNDAMLLAAVFGLAALPDAAFGAVRKFFIPAPSSASSDGSSSGGGSCSGGGGCGGGGGGGCGGCGS
jgi:uncharacterized protein (TIGR04222 family)